MFSAVLALVLAFDQQDTVRVGGKPDSTQSKKVVADSVEEGKNK